MFMKRVLSVALTAFLVIGSFAGCSKSAPKTSAGSGSSQVGGKTVGLTMSIWGDDKRKSQYETLLKDFETSNNCTVDIILVPFNEYMQKLSIQMAAKTAPDAVWLSEAMIPQFINSGNMSDLTSALKNDSSFDLNDFYPTTLDLFKRGQKIYGVPFSFGPRVIFYNKTLFDQKGLETPTQLAKEGKWTLDTFFADAKALTDSSKGVYGMKLVGATEPTAYMSGMYDIVLANGADFFNSDVTKFTLNTPAGVKSMQEVYNALFVDQSCVKPGDQTQFETGKIAMARDTFSYAANLRGKVNFDWDIVCQPTGPDKNAKVVSGFAGYFVTKTSAHQSLAVNLVKYLTGKKIMTTLISTFPSPRKSILDSDAFLNQPQGQPSKESVKLAFVDPIAKPGVQSLPACENMQQVTVQMTSLYEMMFTKEYTPQQIVSQMQEKVDPLLKN